jgi:hypothetical protein
MVDFRRADGSTVMRTVADYRQLNDALFHAGLNSGSQYEWEDTPNRLHFYVVDLQRDAAGVLSYTLGVRSLDGAGPHARGVALAAPPASLSGPEGVGTFTLTNTGSAAAIDEASHPADAAKVVGYDIYRMSVTTDGKGWTASLQNALAAARFGGSSKVAVFVRRAAGAAQSATVTLKAVSESDPGKTASATWTVRGR